MGKKGCGEARADEPEEVPPSTSIPTGSRGGRAGRTPRGRPSKGVRFRRPLSPIPSSAGRAGVAVGAAVQEPRHGSGCRPPVLKWSA